MQRNRGKQQNGLSFDLNADVKYLLTFDEIYQQNLAVIKSADIISTPTHRVVNASEVGVEATTGNRMLQYNFPLMKKSEGYKGAWHRWTIPEQMMRLFWQAYFYNPELTNPYVIPREEWKDWVFCFDVYNASAFTYNLSLKFFAAGSKWSNAGATAEMVPGEWVTVYISVDTIAADLTRMGTWKNEEGVVLQPEQYYLNEERITDPGYLWITHLSTPTVTVNGVEMDDPNVKESFTRMTYYFDSFRVVHV